MYLYSTLILFDFSGFFIPRVSAFRAIFGASIREGSAVVAPVGLKML